MKLTAVCGRSAVARLLGVSSYSNLSISTVPGLGKSWRNSIGARRTYQSEPRFDVFDSRGGKWLGCPAMDFKRLDRGELIAMAGGLILAVSLALAWYSLGNKYARVTYCRGAGISCTGWESMKYARYLILLAGI